MESLNGSENITGRHRGGVIALGNFDGFHKGHQAVIGRAVELARQRGVSALVGTFDPHPAEYFKPDGKPIELTGMDQRLALIETFGADAAVIFHFNEGLAEASPAAFVTDWLASGLGVSAVVTGRDFTFGRDRAGNVEMLDKLCADMGIEAEAVAPIADQDGIVSSTRIRNALREGRISEANRLLTRPYTIEGIVGHGDKLGRTIGFPTANVMLGRYLRPAYGVYAVRCRLSDGRVFNGAANIGIRPMFDPPKELLEVHLFDFAGDLYGQKIAVELHHYLRPEARFDGLDALVEQIAADCTRAKELLAA
jgi:riboflavin kinase/FMN adenylyltransferase